MTDTSSLNHPLWEILDYRGQSIVWLARKTGYATSTVYGFKGGAWPISAEFRQRATEAMDLPEHVLFRLEDKSSSQELVNV